jgi:hypothetical protein
MGCYWASEIVERFGQEASLAFDSGGMPHISFSSSRQTLRYAKRMAQGWDVMTVEDQGQGGDTGHRTSLALDSSGLPRISYLLKYTTGDVYTYDLRYAQFDGTAWTLETVDAPGETGWDSSLALDKSGQPRISYYRSDQTVSVKFAERLGGQWNIETVDTKAGTPSSLRVDSSGRPLVAYHGLSKDHLLRFAYRTEAGWQTETVDSQGVDPNGGTRASVSLALDSSDNPHIAYVDFNTGTLKYASRLNGGGWAIDVIDQGSVNYCSLQIDHNNVAHISYLDLTHGTLKYAVGPALH